MSTCESFRVENVAGINLTISKNFNPLVPTVGKNRNPTFELTFSGLKLSKKLIKIIFVN